MTREEWQKRADDLRKQLIEKRAEVESLEAKWKRANRRARGDWSEESYRLNKWDDDLR